MAKLEIRNTNGFKAKITYSEGHEDDMGPYEIEKYGLVAVSITTIEFKGERVYLCDIGTALGKKLPAESWKEILFAAFDECRSAGCPLVFIVHGWFTGDKEKNRDRWDVFEAFLDYLQGNGAKFVTVRTLAH